MTFDPKNLEVTAYLVGKPDCPRCYGRGYTGITVEGVVLPCKCVVVKEPITAQMVEQMEHLRNAMLALSTQIHDGFEEIKERRISSKVKRLFKRE